MDLIPGILGFRQFAGDEPGAAGGIHFLRVLESLLGGKDEDLLEHLDDVVVSVIVIVEEHDLIELRVRGVASRSNSR
jgi:hypothetical protein